MSRHCTLDELSPTRNLDRFINRKRRSNGLRPVKVNHRGPRQQMTTDLGQPPPQRCSSQIIHDHQMPGKGLHVSKNGYRGFIIKVMKKQAAIDNVKLAQRQTRLKDVLTLKLKPARDGLMKRMAKPLRTRVFDR
jgi:hypothetical protein